LQSPNARIGFSGKRVIQDTVKEDLPKDFQTAEKQLEKGFVDKIVDRRELRNFVSKILKILN
jgi:Acetyl-CoA carboxylase beta subunit